MSNTDKLEEFLRAHTQSVSNKEDLAHLVATRFNLTKRKSVYTGPDFSIRFSTATRESFSNCILSLSALQNYDHMPFFVCVVKPHGFELLLANSTFLKKISHSSRDLRIDNVRGTFLGHDIVRVYDDIENVPSNFPLLFEIHQQFSWDENLARLVHSTNQISATGARFTPNADQIDNILGTAKLSYGLSTHPAYRALEEQLRERVALHQSAILEAAAIDNVNIRGNRIQEIVLHSVADHGLADLSYELGDGLRVLVDLKTKLLHRSSSPKAYNVDKLLRAISDGTTTLSFAFLGIDLSTGSIFFRLVSFLDQTIMNATRIQHHWAGRNSRGVTQLAGGVDCIFEDGYRETINVDKATEFLRQMTSI